MGNGNSSNSGHHNGAFMHQHPLHFQQSGPPGHGHHGKWFSSLDHPEHNMQYSNHHRNRMKKGYFPPAKPYVPKGAIPAQKVLPTQGQPPDLNKLKQTSNGAILHKGGTISGKKLLAELEDSNTVLRINQWSPTNSTSNSNSNPTCDSVNGTNSSGRNYDSEPEEIHKLRCSSESREIAKISPSPPPVVPVPVQCTSSTVSVQQESPTKKQIIKSKKKYAAPPPPPVVSNTTTFNFADKKSPEHVDKSHVSPRSSSSPEGQKRKSPTERLYKTKDLQKEEQKLLENERKILANLTKTSNSQLDAEIARNSRNSRNSNKSYANPNTPSPAPQTSNNLPNKVITKDNKAITCTSSIGTDAQKENPKSPVNPPITKEKTEPEGSKKTFYFGMDDNDTSCMSLKPKASNGTQILNINNSSPSKLEKKPIVAAVGKSTVDKSSNSNEPKVNVKSSTTSQSNSNQNHASSNSNFLVKNVAGNVTSGSRTVESLSQEGSVSLKGKYATKSNGDLSESEDGHSSLTSDEETDIPLLLRPTLPQRRPELPRFSPTAAWQSLEIDDHDLDSSPVMGHRSFTSSSAEEHLGGSSGGKRSSSNSRHLLNRGGDGTASSGFQPERSGDSGISAGDAGSPSNVQPVVELQRSRGFRGRKEQSLKPNGLNKYSNRELWTPEMDLDESSSDFDTDGGHHKHNSKPPSSSSKNLSSSLVNCDKIIPNGLKTPPKLTTRRNLFARRGYLTTSDSDSGQKQHQQHSGGKGSYLPKHFKKKILPNGGSNSPSTGHAHAMVENSSLKRLPSRTNYSQFSSNLDSNWLFEKNWFLSRSEPNSLHLLGGNGYGRKGLAQLSRLEPKMSQNVDNLSSPLTYNEDLLRKAFDSSADILQYANHHLANAKMYEEEMREVRSEIGYGPSSMNFYRSPTLDDGKIGGTSLPNGGGQLFSHIMYLPAYDSRRLNNNHSTSNANNAFNLKSRRAKSVENLDGCSTLGFSYKKGSELGSPSPPPPSGSKSQVKLQRQTPVHVSGAVQETFAEKKKKFKFQSTIRVQERLIMERELAKEAQEQEMERLREIETMQKVEEEFQRKRAREKKELQLQMKIAELGSQNAKNLNKIGKIQTPHAPSSPVSVSDRPPSTSTKVNKSAKTVEKIPAQPLKKENFQQVNGHHSPVPVQLVKMSQRGEPEGACAPSVQQISPINDLRKEIMMQSKKRNAHLQQQQQQQSDLIMTTQELSEYRQEPSRQYCDYIDYRKSPGRAFQPQHEYPQVIEQQQQPVKNKFYKKNVGGRKSKSPDFGSRHSSNSNSNWANGSNAGSSGLIPPQGRYRSTVHPEVVCDIPPKPYPHLVNFSSRLSSSSSNLVDVHHHQLNGERPGSGASSIISDNYRRDWAKHNGNMRGGPAVGGLGHRAISIASLHSTELLHESSPGLHKRKSPLFHKYSSSPPSSPLPTTSASSKSSHSGEAEKESSSTNMMRHTNNKSTILIEHNFGPSSGVFQPQPYRAKGYRPVAFIPNHGHGHAGGKVGYTVL